MTGRGGGSLAGGRGALTAALLCSILAGCSAPSTRFALDIPDGLPHRMSLEQVVTLVRRHVASNVTALGRELRPFRVTRVVLLPRDQWYRVIDAEGSDTGVVYEQHVTSWAVEYEGTYRACDATGCQGAEYGVVIINDATGGRRGESPRGPLVGGP